MYASDIQKVNDFKIPGNRKSELRYFCVILQKMMPVRATLTKNDFLHRIKSQNHCNPTIGRE